MDRLNILYTNIRSLKNHFNELILLLEKYKEEKNLTFDLIALSETWVNKEQLSLFRLEGYRSFIQPRLDGRRSGGVAWFAQKDLKITDCKPIPIKTGNALKLTLPTSGLRSNNTTINLIYRDCTSSKQTFVTELERLLETEKHETLILGDININILNNQEAADYLDVIEASGLKSEMNEPTRETACLDHVMVRGQSFVTCTKILEETITDHAVIHISLTSQDNNFQKLDNNRKYYITNNKQFQQNIKKQNWCWTADQTTSVNRLFERLTETVQRCQQKATRVITFRSDKKGKSRQPWITPALMKLTSDKAAAYKLLMQNRDSSEFKENFKHISKLVKYEARKEKVKYYSNLLNKNVDNPKRYWQIVNNFREVKKENDIDDIILDDIVYKVDTSPDKIADGFNLHYKQLPEKYNNSQNYSQDYLLQDFRTRCTIDTKLDGFILSASDVERAIHQLKNKNSSALDGISASTIKKIPIQMAKILTPLFNTALKRGEFPKNLKTAIVIPIFKNGDKKLFQNYRPISLISVFSKIYEKCVKEKILNYLDHINFFAPQQFGFLKEKSTDSALFNHITQITESIEANKATMAVYLDLAKAFDTVSTKILLRKLNKIGIEGPLLTWFKTYLDNRKQVVRIGEHISSAVQIKWGFPQGSVLGPLLFLIYINYLYLQPLRAKITGYADDTSLLYSSNSKQGLESDFRYDTTILLKWFKQNLLHLNLEKCKMMVFGYKTPEWAEEIKISLSETEPLNYLERVYEIKVLGIYIDQKLTWKSHSVYLQTKLRKLNYLFFHLRRNFNQHHMLKLYQPLYESVMSYGIIHWGASAHIKPIKVLQNKVCRSILNLDRMTSEADIYSKMGNYGVSLVSLYKRRVGMFIFKHKGDFQIHDTVSYTRTGGGVVAAYPGYTKHHSRIQLCYKGYEIFNKLPSHCRNENRIATYKKQLRGIFT